MRHLGLATPHEVGAAVRARRIELGLRQRDLAELAFVSRQWIIKFEAGHDNAELVRALAVVRALGLRFSLVEDEGESPGEFDLDDVLGR